MGEEKKICPLMSGVVPLGPPPPSHTALGDRPSNIIKEIPCKKDECALWDSLLKCCSHMSPLIEGRTNIREIIAGLVAAFEEDQVTAEEKLVEVKEGSDETTTTIKRIGELEGKIDVIEQVCEILKRRFMVSSLDKKDNTDKIVERVKST